MDTITIWHNYATVGAIVFGVGLCGVLTRRNLIVVLLSVELMLQGAALVLVAADVSRGEVVGQVLVLLTVVVAAAEVAIALALFVVLARRRFGLDSAAWQTLREDNQPAFEITTRKE